MCTAENVYPLILHKESARVVTIKSAHTKASDTHLSYTVCRAFFKKHTSDHLKSRRLQISVLVFLDQIFVLVFSKCLSMIFHSRVQ